MSDSGVLDLSIPNLLIASIVVVSVLAWRSPALMKKLILNPYLVRERREVHRLLTAGWVHSDITHLFFNMFTLYFFASPVLRILGPFRFLALYLSAVIVAHLPTTFRHMHDPKYNSLGASGAVSAITFACVLLYPGMKLSLMFIPIPIPGVLYAVGYVAYSFVQSRRGQGNINHDAHLFGAIYGALLTFVFEPARALYSVGHLF